MYTRKVHSDCPFKAEEIQAFEAMLFSVNTTHQCINPAPLSWAKAYQWQQAKELNEYDNEQE